MAKANHIARPQTSEGGARDPIFRIKESEGKGQNLKALTFYSLDWVDSGDSGSRISGQGIKKSKEKKRKSRKKSERRKEWCQSSTRGQIRKRMKSAPYFW